MTAGNRPALECGRVAQRTGQRARPDITETGMEARGSVLGPHPRKTPKQQLPGVQIRPDSLWPSPSSP
uniref:Uncharacterized protein n=1 Tax=Anguilla anguilla TaxID=7936 RepID=A0A0E9RAM0_ANGAN